jgi:hypothetical protein
LRPKKSFEPLSSADSSGVNAGSRAPQRARIVAG